MSQRGDPPEPPGGRAEPDRRARILLSVLEDLREERERFARESEQRRQAEQRFRATIDAAPTAMVMIDRHGTIVLSNVETLRLFGYGEGELLGKPVEVLVPERSRDSHPSLRDGFFERPESRRMGAGRELFGVRRDGSEFPIEIGLNPVETEEGLFVLSAIVDISERKRLEEAQRQLNRELERRVEERTGELSVARDAAQAANRAKSDFLANMSHEIRTPLNAVIGLTEVLSRTPLDSTQSEHLETVRSSAEALLTVINDVLDFSKIEAGKLKLEQVAFDLREPVESTLKALAGRAIAAGVDVGCFVDPGLAVARVGDPVRVRQVLSNLANNAIKFSPSGEVEVRVEEGSEPGWVRFSVQDTGVGIPPDQMERLFAPFEQADSSTTRRFGGTGLGLSISRQLVELMSGTIGAESRRGPGSLFYFEVPLEQASPEPARPPEVLEGRAVLIVSGHAMQRRHLEQLLGAWGMRPRSVDTLEAALEALQGSRQADEAPPVVLADSEGAGVDGYELAGRVRGHSELEHVEIVLLCPSEPGPDLARCERLGVRERVAKPCSQRDLARALASALGEPVVEPGRLDASGGEDEPDLSHLRILLVDDSAANRMVARAILGEQAQRIDAAENGRQALDVLASGEYDVVLMDVQMPEMDGFEAATAIRAAEAETGGHLPIVAMTAHALAGDRERCIAAGMDDYVSKPVRRSELLGALARVTGSASKTS